MISLAGGAHTRSTIRSSYIFQEGRRKSSQHRVVDENSFKIADIHILPLTESKDVSLLAVTSTGTRLYFGHKALLDYNSQRNLDQANTGPYLLHVRIPPTFDNAPEGVLGPQGHYCIHQSLYSNGVFIAAHSLHDAADVLIATAPDSGPINKLSTASQVSKVDRRDKKSDLSLIVQVANILLSNASLFSPASAITSRKWMRRL